MQTFKSFLTEKKKIQKDKDDSGGVGGAPNLDQMGSGNEPADDESDEDKEKPDEDEEE